MRLLIVSNRLPFTAIEEGEEITFRESIGGLVSGLSSYPGSLKDTPFTQASYIWIGWPEVSIPEER
jgi:trehalose 6-phosphate synthase/phosphatase